jgi:PadR family transcriptional regulator
MLILQMVASGPIHGYAIAQRGESRLADWKESDTGREAKFYKLTAKGRAQLKTETANWLRLSEAIGLILESRRRLAMNWWQHLGQKRHLEDRLLVAAHLRRRRLPARARRAARLEFGGLDQVKDDCRDARGTLWVETACQDIRFAARTLRKTPGFTAAGHRYSGARNRRLHRHLQRRLRRAARPLSYTDPDHAALVRSLLFGVGLLDPPAFGAVATVLLLTAAIGCYTRAPRRTSRFRDRTCGVSERYCFRGSSNQARAQIGVI